MLENLAYSQKKLVPIEKIMTRHGNFAVPYFQYVQTNAYRKRDRERDILDSKVY